MDVDKHNDVMSLDVDSHVIATGAWSAVITRAPGVRPMAAPALKRAHRPEGTFSVVTTLAGANAFGWHFATSVVECVLRKLFIIGICHRVGASWRSEPTWDAQYYHGTTKKSTPCLLVRHKHHRHTNHHAAASLLGATHDTNATRPTTSATAPPCLPPTRCTAGLHARSRARRNIFSGSSLSRRRRWCVQDVQELPEMPQPAENQGRVPAPR